MLLLMILTTGKRGAWMRTNTMVILMMVIGVRAMILMVLVQSGGGLYEEDGCADVL